MLLQALVKRLGAIQVVEAIDGATARIDRWCNRRCQQILPWTTSNGTML